MQKFIKVPFKMAMKLPQYTLSRSSGEYTRRIWPYRRREFVKGGGGKIIESDKSFSI